MTDRGQTLIDYAIGVGLFLIAVAVVFSYVPGMLDPFSADQDHVQLADRTASQLSEHSLARPGEPFVLDAACADDFFDEDGSIGACPFPFPQDGSNLTAALGTDHLTRLNVTGAEADGTPVDRGVRLTAGDDPTAVSGSVTSARRTVHYRDRTYQLVVRVW